MEAANFKVTCVFQPGLCRLVGFITSSTAHNITGQGTETSCIQVWSKFGSRRLAQDRKRLDRGKLKGTTGHHQDNDDF